MSAEELQIFVFGFYIEKNPLLVHCCNNCIGSLQIALIKVCIHTIKQSSSFLFRNTPFTHRGWLNGPRCEWDSDFSAEMQRRGKLEIYCNSFHQSEYAKSCIQPKPPHIFRTFFILSYMKLFCYVHDKTTSNMKE